MWNTSIGEHERRKRWRQQFKTWRRRSHSLVPARDVTTWAFPWDGIHGWLIECYTSRIHPLSCVAELFVGSILPATPHQPLLAQLSSEGGECVRCVPHNPPLTTLHCLLSRPGPGRAQSSSQRTRAGFLPLSSPSPRCCGRSGRGVIVWNQPYNGRGLTITVPWMSLPWMRQNKARSVVSVSHHGTYVSAALNPFLG